MPTEGRISGVICWYFRSTAKGLPDLLPYAALIAPTLEIRPGYQFNIVVTKDVVFERPYTAWR
jgi:hypothetical protein